MLAFLCRFGTACGHKQLKVPPRQYGGIMEIYTNKTGDPGLTFRVKHSRHNINFTIRLVNNKPKLIGWWHSFGGFGGRMDLSKAKLWSYFIKELKGAVMKDQLKFIN